VVVGEAEVDQAAQVDCGDPQRQPVLGSGFESPQLHFHQNPCSAGISAVTHLDLSNDSGHGLRVQHLDVDDAPWVGVVFRVDRRCSSCDM
jgi:hypothetical protein